MRKSRSILCLAGCVLAVSMFISGCGENKTDNPDNVNNSANIEADNQDEPVDSDNQDEPVDSDNQDEPADSDNQDEPADSDNQDESEDDFLDSDIEGKWSLRMKSRTNIDPSRTEMECDVLLSIDVKEDMTEEDMLSILNYYWVKKFDSGRNYCDTKVNSCYVVFFKENTFDIVDRMKMTDGKKQEISEEDEYMFERLLSFDEEKIKENEQDDVW